MTDIIIGPTTVERFTDFIENAPLADPVTVADYVPVIQGGVTKKFPANQAGGNVSITEISSGSVYVVADSDEYLAVAKTVPGVLAITLPPSPASGRQLQIADCAGNAGTYAITVNGNGKNIDANATYIMQFDWQTLRLVYTGVLWKLG